MTVTRAGNLALISVPKLLGDWNWPLPRWLGWFPNFSVEGERPRPIPPPAPSQPSRTREPV